MTTQTNILEQLNALLDDPPFPECTASFPDRLETVNFCIADIDKEQFRMLVLLAGILKQLEGKTIKKVQWTNIQQKLTNPLGRFGFFAIHHDTPEHVKTVFVPYALDEMTRTLALQQLNDSLPSKTNSIIMSPVTYPQSSTVIKYPIGKCPDVLPGRQTFERPLPSTDA